MCVSLVSAADYLQQPGAILAAESWPVPGIEHRNVGIFAREMGDERWLLARLGITGPASLPVLQSRLASPSHAATILFLAAFMAAVN